MFSLFGWHACPRTDQALFVWSDRRVANVKENFSLSFAKAAPDCRPHPDARPEGAGGGRPISGLRQPPPGEAPAQPPEEEQSARKGAADHAMAPGADPELLATTVAWAIFGAARRWYQTPDHISAEEMAAGIEAMVKPIFLSASVNFRP